MHIASEDTEAIRGCGEMHKSMYLSFCVRALALWAACTVTPAVAGQTAPRTIGVDERIQAATSALGEFERTQRYGDFQSVLQTLLEVNGKDPAAAPLSDRWDVQGQQMKEAYGAWFEVFRALDAMKIANYDPLAPANECSLTIAPTGGYPGINPEAVTDPEIRKQYERALAENEERCARNNVQALLPHFDEMAQQSFREFLGRMKDSRGYDFDLSASSFAFSLGSSTLSGARIALMWKIYAARNEPNWKPQSLLAAYPSAAPFAFTDDVTAAQAKRHLSEWFDFGDPRAAAWAAHYVLRYRLRRAIPLLLSYVHVHGFDPAFNMNTDYVRYGLTQAEPADDAMAAALDTLIELRVHVPAEDLLQLAQAFPDQAMILGLLPQPQNRVLEFFYLADGMNLKPPDEDFFRSRRVLGIWSASYLQRSEPSTPRSWPDS